jgi:hypothetical protein
VLKAVAKTKIQNINLFVAFVLIEIKDHKFRQANICKSVGFPLDFGGFERHPLQLPLKFCPVITYTFLVRRITTVLN